MRTAVGIVLFGGVCLCLSAADPTPPESPKLVAARAEYFKALDKAHATFEESAKEAAAEYKKNLSALMEAETKSGRLDAAVAFRDEIKRVEEGIAATKKDAKGAELKKALIGTKWSEGPLTLQKDGLVKNPGWEGFNCVIRWEAVDRRTVVLTVEKGRDHNRIAVFQFSEALDEYTMIDFDGSIYKIKPKRLKK